MSYRLPIGPYHPALREPMLLDLAVSGTTVEAVELGLGYNHRGVEWLAERNNLYQNLGFLERLCGTCSHSNLMVFCQCVESIARLAVPLRARYIRTAVAELERIQSHLLWTAWAIRGLGFESLHLHTLEVREAVLQVLEAACGRRLHYALCSLGGVRSDLADLNEVVKALGNLKRPLYEVVDTTMHDRGIISRTVGVGPLSREDAIELGVVGPVARASGIGLDIRKHAPYAAYDEVGVSVVTQEGGDTYARLVVRLLECFESFKIIERTLELLPGGDYRYETMPPLLAKGEGLSRVEAPGGENFCFVKMDGSDTPQRVKLRGPAYVNLPALQRALIGQDIADVAVIVASFGPCLSCAER
jgi:Ni,Fe-hydrogenase III large subunit